MRFTVAGPGAGGFSGTGVADYAHAGCYPVQNHSGGCFYGSTTVAMGSSAGSASCVAGGTGDSMFAWAGVESSDVWKG